MSTWAFLLRNTHVFLSPLTRDEAVDLGRDVLTSPLPDARVYGSTARGRERLRTGLSWLLEHFFLFELNCNGKRVKVRTVSNDRYHLRPSLISSPRSCLKLIKLIIHLRYGSFQIEDLATLLLSFNVVFIKLTVLFTKFMKKESILHICVLMFIQKQTLLKTSSIIKEFRCRL